MHKGRRGEAGTSEVTDQLRSCCNNPDVKQRGPGLRNKEKMGKYKQQKKFCMQKLSGIHGQNGKATGVFRELI
ncbi:Hypothetical predicted protein [Lynx pardinus]|uniref:Uncharacterized protein n=1 Tax=Lynx pardinus TaxID=191816 RepID=A0A485PA31_LYNPA|nr:Hypothetical predicted protein [Lynx pardinus]